MRRRRGEFLRGRDAVRVGFFAERDGATTGFFLGSDGTTPSFFFAEVGDGVTADDLGAGGFDSSDFCGDAAAESDWRAGGASEISAAAGNDPAVHT